MPGKSTSFQQITPFQPKTGLFGSSYVAFPVDNNGNFLAPTLDIELSCRSRSGTASLIGFNAVTGFESTPPKKFRTLTGSGRAERCNYDAPGCNPVSLQGSDSNTYQGVRSYDVLTGVLSGSGTITVRQDGGFCPATTIILVKNLENDYPIAPLSGGDENGFSLTETETSQTVTGLEVCFDPSDSHPSSFASGSVGFALSNEDTEENAIARFEANNDWSEWALNSRCLSSRQNRTSGFTFGITEGQFKMEIGGLPPNREFAASIDVYRSIRGDDNFVFFNKIFFTATSSLSGTAEITGNVPIYVGYDSFVTSPAIL